MEIMLIGNMFMLIEIIKLTIYLNQIRNKIINKGRSIFKLIKTERYKKKNQFENYFHIPKHSQYFGYRS